MAKKLFITFLLVIVPTFASPEDKNRFYAPSYDSSEVCQFVDARYFEMARYITKASPGMILELPSDSNIYKPTHRYTNKGAIADFVAYPAWDTINEFQHFGTKGFYIEFFSLDANAITISEKDKKKTNLLARLGVTRTLKSSRIEVWCEYHKLRIFFIGDRLNKIEVTNTYHG
jgi:hypothetical protein